MRSLLLCTLTYLFAGIHTEPQHVCMDDERYRALGICVVENVDIDELTMDDFANLSNEAHLEFRNANIPYFGVELFQQLGDTRRVTFRNGFVREIMFWSPSIKMLRMINTDLTVFDVVGQPNYSLKELTIRSEQFSDWYPDMRLLEALEVIDIGYCNFSYLDLDWFGGYRNLRVLDVSFNRLHAVHSGPYLVLDSLEELFLAGNRLEYVWRFPDAFPKLNMITMSSNRWLCDWVSMAREAIWIKGIVALDSDFNCAIGWTINGGLCCRRSGDVNQGCDNRDDNIVEKQQDPKKDLDLILTVRYSFPVNEQNDTMEVTAEMGDTTVFVDQPLNN